MRGHIGDYARALSRVPAWVTLPMAVGLHVGCAWLGHGQVLVFGSAPEDRAAAGIVRSLALVGAWLLPFVCLLAAVLWLQGLVARVRMRQLAREAAEANVLRGLDWRTFEAIVAAGFSHKGFDAQLTADGEDGGIDVRLRKGDQVFFVQAKHWRDRSVGVEVVRSLYGVICAEGASGGYVVSSGIFTKAAMEFVAGKPVWLITGQRLRSLLAAGEGQAGGRLALDRLQVKAGPGDVACPLCDRPMVLREAKRGVHSGKRFYGCSHFPGCAGLRPVD